MLQFFSGHHYISRLIGVAALAEVLVGAGQAATPTTIYQDASDNLSLGLWQNRSSTLHGVGEEAESFSADGQIGVGYESNVFEVNQRFENGVGDEFLDSKFELTAPFTLFGYDWVARLESHWKKYLNQNQIDEYLVRPDLACTLIDTDAVELKVDGHVALLRERMFNEFSRAPNKAEPGLTGGGGSELELHFSEQTRLNLTADIEYETLFSALQDNMHATAEARVEYELRKQLIFNAGTNWDFQDYLVRPQDVEARINPRGLTTLEGRGFISLEGKPWKGCELEVQVKCGPNVDLTNGYYNASVAGAQLAMRQKLQRWEVVGAIEPEFVVFQTRPANLSKPNAKLHTAEYLFELGLRFKCSEHVVVFCSEALHIQVSSSNDRRTDSTLNSFADNMVSSGVRIAF